MNFSGEGPADAGRKKRDFNPDEVVSIALDICELMLENGAEVHRIEDTAERICLAYGAEKVEIFAITSLIAATITMKDGRDWTQTRRVYRGKAECSVQNYMQGHTGAGTGQSGDRRYP